MTLAQAVAHFLVLTQGCYKGYIGFYKTINKEKSK